MKVVLQRVRNASVRVGGREISRIGKGLLLLVAVEKGDQTAPQRKDRNNEDF